MEDLSYGSVLSNITNDTQFGYLKISNDTDLSTLVQSYNKIPTWILLLSLFLFPIGMVLQFFIIIFERFEMDSMKRGLFNQVVFIKSTFISYSMGIANVKYVCERLKLTNIALRFRLQQGKTRTNQVLRNTEPRAVIFSFYFSWFPPPMLG